MARGLQAILILAALVAPGAAPAGVLINEIMYNSPGGTDVEYVELLNTGPGAQNLDGWYLLDDDDAHDRCFLVATLQPGDYLVVAGDFTLFIPTYGGAGPFNPNPFGVGFGLGNTADVVRLFDAADALVDSVAYEDGGLWPGEADGDGPSLELLNPVLDNGLPSSWAASVNGIPGGTPGLLNSVFLDDPPPTVSDVRRDIALPTGSDPVVVTAVAQDDQPLAMVELFVDTGAGFAAQLMFDDGNNGDGAAGDAVYGTTVPPQPTGTLVRYYAKATDSLGQTATDPGGAPAEYLAYTVDHTPPPLRINEVLARNENVNLDEGGDSNDWAEIYNPGPDVVSLEGMFLSDDLGQTRLWEFPEAFLGPGEYLLVWCDDEQGQGPLHTNFTLGLDGDEIALYDTVDHGNQLIHGFRFGRQSTDISYGFLPDDSDAPDYLAVATPQASNDGSSFFSPVCINEFLAGSQLPGVPDWIEVYNRSGAPVDISGWFLSDDPVETEKYAFPGGTVLLAGGFLSVDENALGFGISAAGNDVIVLTDSNGSTGRGYFDHGDQFSDVSQGRFPDGSSDWHFFNPSTRDLANACDPGLPALDPVTGLRFDAPDALGWDELGQAQAYDVTRGDLQTLLDQAGDFSVAMIGCLENNGGDPRSFDGSTPAAGAGFFYLARGVNFACGFGTWDSGSPSQVAGRDPSVQASASTCP